MDAIETKEFGGKKHKVCDGTWYSEKTTDEAVRLLERIRREGTRVRFHWGDVGTGLDWGDEYDVAGTIGRSMGPVKIPILVHSRRSMGGGGILTDCVVKVVESKGKRVIWQHPSYHAGTA